MRARLLHLPFQTGQKLRRLRREAEADGVPSRRPAPPRRPAQSRRVEQRRHRPCLGRAPLQSVAMVERLRTIRLGGTAGGTSLGTSRSVERPPTAATGRHYRQRAASLWLPFRRVERADGDPRPGGGICHWLYRPTCAALAPRVGFFGATPQTGAGAGRPGSPEPVATLHVSQP